MKARLGQATAAAIFTLVLTCAAYSQPGSTLVTVAFAKGSYTASAGTQLTVELLASIKEGWHINSDKPNDELLIPTRIKSLDKSFPLAEIAYPKPVEKELAISEKPVSVFEDRIKIPLTFTISPSAAPGKYRIPVEFSYQGCNDRTCMPPTGATVELAVEVTAGGGRIPAPARGAAETTKTGTIGTDSGKPSSGAELSPAGEKDGNSLESTIEKSGLFISLLFIFLGGLALNLTPCVYPMIPITVGYFGGQTEGKTSRLFLLGILYMLGMALTYSVIGVVTSLSGAVFGTLMQNPYVIAGIVVLFIVLALSQFGVYEFQLPQSWVAKAGGAKGGRFGAFFMGLTMGIVAAPCIGPFVLGLVTYVAAKGDPFYGFLMFFVLALGLGFPYLILALFSGKIKNLPRSGEWMEGVKHIFGFLLLAMAIYFGLPLLPKAAAHYALPLFGILSALYLIFIDRKGKGVRGFIWFKNVFSVVVVAVAVWALIPSKGLHPDWQAFSETNYERSLKAGERMVVDFYADWCIPCKELDATTFADGRVLDKMKAFSAYKVDMTASGSLENEALRKKFSIVGMPTVLVINAKGEEVDRLTGYVNADEFLPKLSKAD